MMLIRYRYKKLISECRSITWQYSYDLFFFEQDWWGIITQALSFLMILYKKKDSWFINIILDIYYLSMASIVFILVLPWRTSY